MINNHLVARKSHLQSYTYLYNVFFPLHLFIIFFFFLNVIAYHVQNYPPYLPVSWSDTVLVRALLTTMLDEASPTTRGAITTQSWKTSVTKAYRKQVSEGLVNYHWWQKLDILSCRYTNKILPVLNKTKLKGMRTISKCHFLRTSWLKFLHQVLVQSETVIKKCKLREKTLACLIKICIQYFNTNTHHS